MLLSKISLNDYEQNEMLVKEYTQILRSRPRTGEVAGGRAGEKSGETMGRHRIQAVASCFMNSARKSARTVNILTHSSRICQHTVIPLYTYNSYSNLSHARSSKQSCTMKQLTKASTEPQCKSKYGTVPLWYTEHLPWPGTMGTANQELARSRWQA